MIVSEIKLFEFLVNELKLPESKAKQYVSEIKAAEEKLQAEVREGISRKFEEIKGMLSTKSDISDVRLEMEKMRTEMKETKAELIKWMFIFWIGTVGVLSGIMFAMLNAYLK